MEKPQSAAEESSPMKIHRTLGYLILIASLAGCSTMNTQADFNRRTDFPRYRTFDWFPGAPAGGTDFLAQTPARRDQIRASVEREMLGKGMRYQPGGRADFYVAHHLIGKGNVDESAWGYGMGNWGHGAGSGG
jgi:hypothetical protein